MNFRKYTLLLLISCCFSIQTFAQAKLNGSAKSFIKEYLVYTRSGSEKLLTQLKQDYDLVPINGDNCIGVSAIVDENTLDLTSLANLNIKNDTRLQNLWTFRVPIQNFMSFTHISGINYIEVGKHVSPYMEQARPTARVDSVNLGLGGLTQAYKGKGVIIAIIDWGFDYTHPNFFDSTYTNLRISRAWDQNKLSGPAPEGYSFGAEYLGTSGLLAAEQDTLYVFGPMSHGTHVAGIAGGAGAETPHIGVAPESELIFISLRRDATSFIDACSYIANYAAQTGKPFVVNMSFGNFLGPLDGTALQNLAMDIIQGPGKIFVGSAGNNGTGTPAFHLSYDFDGNPNDTMKTVVGFAPGHEDYYGQSLSMWGSANTSFKVSVLVTDSFNDSLHQTPYYFSADEPNFTDTILVDGDSLIITIESDAKYFLNDSPNIRLQLKKTSPFHKVILHATSDDDCLLHVWNNQQLTNRLTNWGTSLLSNYPGSIGGDHSNAIGGPGASGKTVITVGSHFSEIVNPDQSITGGALSSFSSNGPTIDGRVKPDITSVGSNVMSSINSFDNTQSNTIAVDFNGKTYGFTRFSGTSMSGPLVAGIVALMLEAFPNMSATQAKEIIRSTARLDVHTGAIDPAVGSVVWGWGKANALAAVKAAEIMSSTENLSISTFAFDVYPNPTSKILNIRLAENKMIEEVEIIALNGEQCKQIKNIKDSSLTIDVSELPAGAYLLRVQTNNEFSFRRIVIQ